jgi:integration host factor subunit alpha
MTKADMVQALYSRLGGFSKKESADLVDLVFETMKETLGRGEKIKISGFGNFVLRDKRPRQGRNPQTGTPIMITERRVLSFKASQLLKHALNDEASMASPRKWVGAETWDKPAGGLDLRSSKDGEPSSAGGGSGGT